MKVLFCSDVLEKFSLRKESGDISVHEELAEKVRQKVSSGNDEIWVSAHSLANCAANMGTEASQFLKAIRQFAAVIPLRTSTIEHTSELSLSPTSIEEASANQFGLDLLISDHIQSEQFSVLAFEEFLGRGDEKSVEGVPFLDLAAQLHGIYNTIDDDFTQIISSSGFILGPYVSKFEEEFAIVQQAQHCIGVSSGTDALHVILLALNISTGDKVVVPVNTFFATAEAVSLAGADPLFCDCDDFANLDSKMLAQLLEKDNGSIKAVIAVHLYGQLAEMNAIKAVCDRNGVLLIEDAAQAHLAEMKNNRAGHWGCAAAFSFYPGKNLGAFGEAGAVTTNDSELFQRMKMVRQHGEVERYHHSLVGHNYRMEALQGAALSAKLEFMEGWTKNRQRIAGVYTQRLENLESIGVPLERVKGSSVFHLYVVLAEQRDLLREFLTEKGVATGLHYPIPLHLQQAYESLGYRKGDFPVAEMFASKMLSLPIYPQLSEDRVHWVCDLIGEFYSGQ